MFLDDAPYCFIERVFENPHERPVFVKIEDDQYSRTQSMHQFMRDMLPGTWNHRLIKTGSGHAEIPGGRFRLQLLGNDDLRRFATVLRHGSQNRADGIYGQALRVKSVGESFDTTTSSNPEHGSRASAGGHYQAKICGTGRRNWRHDGRKQHANRRLVQSFFSDGGPHGPTEGARGCCS